MTSDYTLVQTVAAVRLQSPHDIIRQADEMMYMVKNSTRDNIGIAQRGVVK